MSSIYAYFSQHHDYFLFALAGICLLIELSVLGLTGPLLFIAIGCLVTGLLITLKITNDYHVELVLVALISLASAAILWNPLKKIQDKERGPETSSDMVGKILPVTALITQHDGRVSYSGIEWLARLDSSSSDAIEPGNKVKVTGVDGTIFLVRVE